MVANFEATLSVDYTPSVRGGPIFCDVILSTEAIAYPFCDGDADYFVAIDQNGFKRASEAVCEKTISFIDSNTVSKPESVIKSGKILRVPLTKKADELNLTKSTNILSLGFLSEYLHENKSPEYESIELKEEHYMSVLNEMPVRFRETNINTFILGKKLYHEIF
jgi:Pyruvate/2-oxoacid:ferredoxin oxidoreductase gamma subunit